MTLPTYEELETKVRQLEKKLLDCQQGEIAYHVMVESTTDSIMMVDRKCRYLFVNRNHLETDLNLSHEEVIGKSYSDFHSEERTREFAEVVNRVFTEGMIFQREHKSRKDGRQFLQSFSPIRLTPSSSITAVVVISKEITELKRAEESLQHLESLHRRFINASKAMIFFMDHQFRYLLVNTSLLEFLQKNESEVVGKRHTDCMPVEVARICDRLCKRAVKSGTDVLLEEEIEGRFYEIKVFPIGLPDTKMGVSGYIRDITDEKHTADEKNKLEVQLIQAQKMEAIGTLAGGIAHDFNNLLMSIQGYATLMLFHIDEGHPFYQKLKGIETQVQSGANLTKQLLGFARGGKYEAKPTNINEIVARSASLFARTKKEITIHEEYQQHLWTVEADRGQLEQVLLNLYVNAWQAMPQGGDLYISTKNVELDKSYVKHYYVKHGKYVKITVEDTGIGMDKDVRVRIFEPFFTTKEMGRGTGLGLATVYGIIKAHNGIINVYSEKGKGTVFNMYFPISDRKFRKEKLTTQDLLKGTETILLVDDEETIIDVTSELLEELGYRVYTASSGAEAIEIYRSKQQEVSLVILDMIMPSMGGGETFDGLKEINPDIAVILSSGYSMNQQATSIMKRGCRKFLQKPFSSEELSEVIRQVLSANR